MDLTSSDDSDCEQWAASPANETTEEPLESSQGLCMALTSDEPPEYRSHPDNSDTNEERVPSSLETETDMLFPFNVSDTLKDWVYCTRFTQVQNQARRHHDESWITWLPWITLHMRAEQCSVEEFKREFLEELKNRTNALETQLLCRTNRLQEIIKRYTT